jgi:hypothetical protein
VGLSYLDFGELVWLPKVDQLCYVGSLKWVSHLFESHAKGGICPCYLPSTRKCLKFSPLGLGPFLTPSLNGCFIVACSLGFSWTQGMNYVSLFKGKMLKLRAIMLQFECFIGNCRIEKQAQQLNWTLPWEFRFSKRGILAN